jgi:hypothetical protein
MRRDERVFDFVMRAYKAGDERFQHIPDPSPDPTCVVNDECCKRYYPAHFETHPTVRDAVHAANGPPENHVCPVGELVTAPGDVAMCGCGQWFYGLIDGLGAFGVYACDAVRAAQFAREPMDPDETIAALDRAGEYMEVI